MDAPRSGALRKSGQIEIRILFIAIDGGFEMAQLVSVKPDQSMHRFRIARYGPALFIILSLVQIQASPSVGRPAVVNLMQEDQAIRQLEPGKPVEREIAGGP